MAVMVNSVTIILVVILFAIFIALHFYFTRNFKYWQKLGIPYVKPEPVFGNLKDCVFQKMNIAKKFQKIYNENSDTTYIGIFAFHKPCLLIRDTELVKNVLVKDSQNFIDHVVTVNEKLDPLFGWGLFLLKGEFWRHVRSNLTPVFTSGKMKKMFYLVDTCGKELAKFLERATVDGSTVDVADTTYRYTTDVIASCAFGIDGYSLTDRKAEFWCFVKRMFEFSVKKGFVGMTIFCAPELVSVLKLQFMDDVTTHFLRKTVWSTVEYRERNGIVRNDFLDCMMELRNRGKKDLQEGRLTGENPTKYATFQIDGDVFVGQAAVFIAGGYETSGSTLCYALYEIAMHTDIQHRVRAEIVQVLNKHNGQLTYDGIQEMAYLDMVVSETLRKYPPLPFLDRMCCSDYKLPAPTGNGTVVLPAGTAVFIPVLALHYNPQYFPEPKKFDPDRFTEENKLTRPKCTYLPFGEGPRMCIGMRFALMSVKTALCHILSRFEVAPCKDTPAPIVFDPKSFLLTAKGEVPLYFKRTQK